MSDETQDCYETIIYHLWHMYLDFELADIFYFNYGIMIPFLIQYLNVLLTKIEYAMLYFYIYEMMLWIIAYIVVL